MKQMLKVRHTLAVDERTPPAPPLGPADDLPVDYWRALLDDTRARTCPGSGEKQRLNEIPLRVACPLRQDRRDPENDATRLYGPDALWRDVSRRLLDNTCTQRTGRHEEDGCWPSFQ